MKKGFLPLLPALAFVFAAGCWTVHQTPYPDVDFSVLPSGREACVQLSGFEATVTSYVPVYGHETVWRTRPCHRRGYGGWMSSETYSTTTYVPQTMRTTAFVDRARERFEDAGFLVGATNAVWRVDVTFSGPFVTGGDRAVSALWLVCSLLSAEYVAQTWTAGLRVYDARTGRLLMRKELSERYSAVVWGPIPIFSPAAADETSAGFMQNRCLSALTDRAVAEATAFLAAR